MADETKDPRMPALLNVVEDRLAKGVYANKTRRAKNKQKLDLYLKRHERDETPETRAYVERTRELLGRFPGRKVTAAAAPLAATATAPLVGREANEEDENEANEEEEAANEVVPDGEKPARGGAGGPSDDEDARRAAKESATAAKSAELLGPISANVVTGAILAPAVPKATSARNVSAAAEVSGPLPKVDTYCDPITCEPVSGPDALQQIKRRVQEESDRLQRDARKHYRVIPEFDTMNRLDLLIKFLNEDILDDSLLEVLNEKREQKAPQMFESYWDIVIALGRLPEFGITPGRLLYNGKIEGMSDLSLNPASQFTNPFKYLEKSNVRTSSIRGASDITIFYMDGDVTSVDKCSTGGCATQQGSEDPCSVNPAAPKKKPRVVLFSAKLFGKEKSIDKYDIQNIWTAIKPELDIEKNIVLLVRDSDHVNSKFQRAVRAYLSGKVSSRPYGWNDCKAALRILHDNIRTQKASMGVPSVTQANIAELFGIKEKAQPRPFLSLYLHQQMTVDFIVNKVSAKPVKPRFLVGILPRGGKTYIAGGIVRDLQPKRVLVVLGAKTETQSQFIDELFDATGCGFQDFANYTVIDVLTGTKALDPTKKYIFVCSTENLKMKRAAKAVETQAYKFVNDIIKAGLDLILVDEAHQKLLTKRGEHAFRSESGEDIAAAETPLEYSVLPVDKTPTVFMTGTYSKFMSDVISPSFAVPPDHMILWDYEDVQLAKNLEDPDIQLEFTTRFGTFFTNAFESLQAAGKTPAQIESTYRHFPVLYLLTTNFTEDVRRVVQAGRGMPSVVQSQEGKAAFEYDGVEDAAEWWNGLQRPHDMMRLINYLGPSGSALLKIGDDAVLPNETSALDRVDRIGQRVGDRLANLTSSFVPHSQIWFLARSTRGQTVERRMPALASLILKHLWFQKHFDVMCVTQSVAWEKFTKHPLPESRRFKIGDASIIFACPDPKQPLKECICKQEAETRKAKRGLIILTEAMLKLGISLPCVDVVVLLDDSSGLDDRIQKMYRALTQAPYKKAGYIIDLNPKRTVTALIDYQIMKAKHVLKREPTKEDLDNDIVNRVLNSYQIDDDIRVFEAGEEAGDQIAELKKQLKGLYNPTLFSKGSLAEAGKQLNSEINAANIYLAGFNANLGTFKEDAKKKASVREDKSGVDAAPEEKAPAAAAAGAKGAVPAAAVGKPADAAARAKEQERIQKDIVKTTLKLGAFGTQFKTGAELIARLRADKGVRDDLLETLERRGLIPNAEDDSIVERMIVPLLQKSLTPQQEDLYAIMRSKINSSDELPVKEVLEYITDHLAPKDAERHKYGEVFTPLTLVDEMLSKLPQTGADSVWTKKDWKWLDPSNGIGNFPIKALVGQQEGDHKYPGLMKGLENEFHDPAERCKYIVENMLYMIDINGKNNAIARRLFEKLCPGAVANIEKIDAKEGFLTSKPLHFKGKDGVVKEVKEFDVVMGNPPYNSGTTRAMSTNETRNAREKLGVTDVKHKNMWIPFTNKSLDILKKDGFLLFIMPIGWFKPDRTGIYDRMMSNQIRTMRIIFNTDAKRIFGGSGEINVAYFLLEKTPPTKSTTVVDIYNNEETVKFKKSSILSLAHNGLFTKIQNSSPLFKDSEDYHITAISNAKCESGVNKQIHRITDTGDITFVKTKLSHPDQNVPKIILSGAKFPRFLYDKTGEYGVIGTEQHYFTGDGLDKIEQYFKTKLSALLMTNTKYRMKFLEPKYYPDVTKLPLAKITDETLAEYFGFTKDEREAISTTEYPQREYNFKEIACADLKKEKGGADGETKANVSRKVKKPKAAKEPAAAVGGAGNPPPPSTGPVSSAAAPARRSPYPSRTRRARRRA